MHFYRYVAYAFAGLFLEPVGFIHMKAATTAAHSEELNGCCI